ncbi:MAG: elongation factor P [Phycisphaerae bacterium]|nr:elongation factor P [Phycisphaerae bacterium]
MIKAVEMRKGMVVEHEGQLWTVHDFQIVAKGNWRSYIAAKLKNFKSGNVVDARFSTDDKIETPRVEGKEHEFLYREGDNYVFMDVESFDQVSVPADLVPDGQHYLKGNERCKCLIMDGQVLGVELPNVVELRVADTAPMIRGATATNQSKEAVLETGLKIRVPPFIETGETIRLDTRTGEYIERAK